MLARTAARRQHRHTQRILAASFAQLNLPWLAPAQLRWSATHGASPSEDTSRRRRSGSASTQRAKAQVRQLATAADHYASANQSPFPPPGFSSSFRSNADKHVPFDYHHISDAQRDGNPKLSALRPTVDPIILNTTTQNPHELIKVQKGIHGDTHELLQHLHTCIRIGRLNRVEAIIQRLAERSKPDAPELVHAHTAYLEEHLRMLASEGGSETTKGKQTLKAMQKWFETEVRNKGVEVDSKLLVVMIRGAIRGMDGDKRDRAIRRYVQWAESLGEEIHNDVLESEDYDDNEFTILGRVASDFYSEEQMEELQQEFAETKPAVHGYHAPTDPIDLESLPEVSATDQKGGGLHRVKRAMESYFSKPPLPATAPLEEQRERAYERQKLVEETSVDIAIDHWRQADDELKKLGINTNMQTKPMGALMWQWYAELLPMLEKELEEVKKMLSAPDQRRQDDRYSYGPLLELLPLQKVAATTILWVVSRVARGKEWDSKNYEQDMKLNMLTVGLGKQLEQECAMELSKQKVRSIQATTRAARKAKRDLLKRVSQSGPRGLTASDKAKLLDTDLLHQVTWPFTHKVKLGALLIQKLIEAASLPVTREHPRTREKVTQMQPAFLHRSKYVNGKKLGVVMPNPALTKKMESEPLGSLIAKRMPMIVEPKPWSGWSEGGYLHYPNPILRLPQGDKSGKDYFIAADAKGDMGQVYAGLTALSKVPWKVHKDVFKVQLEAWNTGEEIANFAPANPQYDLPPEPEDRSDVNAKRNWLSRLQDIQNRCAGLHSQRCFQNFQLEIARTVVNETLYFPHNMDFRGRAYPIPPYLNHMGADNVRGLLVFAEGKPLGETGLRWLKIHLATVFGYDKASMDERVKFTEEHLDDIYDAARNPLGGKRWWLESEDAWQTLAACFELTKALDSPDPTKFLSTIPIQQDGTCNGLQHYAALGGDVAGARQVNLEPGDRPADVYTAVAEAVKKQVHEDALAGNKIAKELDGRLTRKCVKQPVMTNVYGVTFFGAKEQVERQLAVLFPEKEGRLRRDEDIVSLRMMSHYVATKIFKSLGSMFGGAQAIQHWLGQCADRVATCLTPEQIKQLTNAENEFIPPKPRKRASRKNDQEGQVISSGGTSSSDRESLDTAKPLFKSTVVWTTPLRLPVVQPYRKSSSKEVKTSLQNLTLHEPQVWDPVSKRKQLQAFPPNFIHSLDATHMLLSALKCNEVGMTFAAIHDSFWTHACDVDRLNSLLRDAFVEMHGEDIVGRLREEFQTRYKGCMHLATVNRDSKVGKKIIEYRQGMKETFKKVGSAELSLEFERMQLLESEDADERKKGEDMVTPGSIFASEGDESAFLSASELEGQELGHMPEQPSTHTERDAVDDPAAAAESPEGIVGGSVLDKDTDALAEEGSEIEDYHKPVQEQVTTTTKEKQATKSKKHARKIHVWLPMTFPEVPAKGAFNVKDTLASKYFFH
ncbi:hypothetical protein D0869_13611 [Hortaea werneckii]|uniref:DNA-directed RNA polymerase n=1 Tax=Hortaea werneckii TaxID=91943 RepID=A0A3M6W4V3_HORWE|nr:hypothetical protein D0869_13611 [Hortaea werneckii]